ncbi:hypothetical protein RJ640_025265 [Escallonia rubra]|uniref:Helicase Helix-turn-helix domain-containing protein n=1 Tax=Escallonia rubra TaxID=112253 RepID=A0AA88R055_9ASTE|nr:hypothetical protein RJ640_025265 [Escallonia rubra]
MPANLTAAKFDAWKKWQEDGLSIQEIANFPGRSAPIKEGTVLSYILDAAREGCEIDWTRFCEEIGLKQEAFVNIEGAILKVGSKDKMKPLKDELPEEVTYTHIKACLAMLDLRMSAEVIAPQPSCKADELPADLLERSNLPCQEEREPCELRRPVDAMHVDCASKASEAANPVSLVASSSASQAIAHTDDLLSLRKRQKVDAPSEDNHNALEATESTILHWLNDFENGVSDCPIHVLCSMLRSEKMKKDANVCIMQVTLSDIVKQFNGSTEESIVDLMSYLESEFLVYRKNNLYKLM